MAELTTTSKNSDWDLVIEPKTGWFDIRLGDLYRYRGLIYMFVKRDFVTFYKQTILGPLWYIIQPIVNTIVFTLYLNNDRRVHHGYYIYNWHDTKGTNPLYHSNNYKI